MSVRTLGAPLRFMPFAVALLSVFVFAFLVVQPLVCLGFAVFLAVLGVAIVRPDWVLYSLILTLPLQGILVFTVRANIKISELLGCVLILAVATRFLVWQESFVLDRRITVPLLVFLAIVLFSTLNTPRFRSAMILNQYMQPGVGRDSPDTRSYITALWGGYCALLLFAVPAVLRNIQLWFRALRMLLWSSVGASVFGILQWFYLLRTGDVFDLPGSTQHLNVLHSIAGGFPRTPSSFTEPSVFAFFLVLTLPLTLVAAVGSYPDIMRPKIASVMLALQGIALLLSFSVSGYVMSILAILVFGFLASRYASGGRAKQIVRWAMFAIVAMLVMGPLLEFVGVNPADVSGFLFDRLVGDADSAQIRFGLGRAAWDMAKDHYLTGVGMGNYPFLVLGDPTAFPAGLLDFQLPTPSNLFLLYLAELGIPGLLFFLWLLLSVYRFLASGLRNISADLKLLHVGLCASMGGALLSFFFLDNLFVNYLWVILGMAVGLYRVGQPQQDSRLQENSPA